jgi:nucleoside-diphosphate-sugar epimerase
VSRDVQGDVKRVLVAGALGLVGRAVVEHYAAAGVPVVGISRRPSDPAVAGEHLCVDLNEPASCRALERHGPFSHVVYAALFELPDLVAGWRDAHQIEVNYSMLANLLEVATPGAHLTLLQGTKAYGAHLAPMRLPGRETDARHPGANFYWVQEDLVRERAARDGFSFTIMRPQVLFGVALRSPMNVALALGVLGAIARARGEPLRFPGGGDFVTEATDTALLARAIAWAGSNPRSAGETYNVTNGDVLEWRALFEDVADYFGVDTGPAEPRSLAATMPDEAPFWARLAAEHRLVEPDLDRLAGGSWQFADAVFGLHGGRTTALSTIRIRQHGFGDCVDSAASLARCFDQLRLARVLPQ